MADIPFPNRVTGSRSKLHVIYPGQIIHQSPYTGSRTVINRSSGLWQGMITFPPRARYDREIQTFLDTLTGASYSFDVPLYGSTIPAVARYTTKQEIAELSMRGLSPNADTTFPFFGSDRIEDPDSRTLNALEHTYRSAAVLSPMVAMPTYTTGSGATLRRFISFQYLSVWAWTDYQAVHSTGRGAFQLQLGALFFDKDDTLLSTDTGLGWLRKRGPIYYDLFTMRPGWHEYGVEIGSSLSRRIHTGATKMRLYLNFVDYADYDGSSRQKAAFANFGLWPMPTIRAPRAASRTYAINYDFDESPVFARVKARSAGDRLIGMKKVGEQLYLVEPYVTPATGALYVKPAWSMTSRLTGQTAGVTMTADWNQEMSIDFMEAL